MSHNLPYERDRVAVIINPTAGRERAGRAAPAIRKSMQTHGIDAQYFYTQARGEGEHLAAAAIADGAELTVAVGGDGTLHEVTNAVLHAPRGRVTLGLIPFGTGNDFARGVGLFGSLDVACKALTEGERRFVDVGHIEAKGLPRGRWFLVAAGMGFVADTAKTVNEGLRGLHGAPAYLIGAAKTLTRMKPFEIDIRLNGNKLKLNEACLVSISNVETTGGGLKIAPGANAEDGILDVCLVGAVSRSVLLSQLPKVVNGTHVNHPDVYLLTAQTVEIATPVAHSLWIDGEIAGETPAIFRLRAGELPMMLPRRTPLEDA